MMGKAAHSLKSSSAMIGCFDFSARCAGLEKACKTGTATPAALAALAEAILQGYPAVETAIDALARQLQAPHPAPPVPKSGFGLSA